MQLAPTDLAFAVDMLNKARYYNDKANDHGTHRLIIDCRSGVRTAHRLGALCGDIVPRPSGGRWRIRIRGTVAEALLTEALPHMSSPKRERAEAALARVNSEAL